MALDIKPTPKLNKKDSKKFLERVEAKACVASFPIPTPKVRDLAKKLIKICHERKLLPTLLSNKDNKALTERGGARRQRRAAKLGWDILCP